MILFQTYRMLFVLLLLWLILFQRGRMANRMANMLAGRVSSAAPELVSTNLSYQNIKSTYHIKISYQNILSWYVSPSFFGSLPLIKIPYKHMKKWRCQASGFSAVTKVIEKLPGPLKEVPSSYVRPGHRDGGNCGDDQCRNGDLDEIIIWIIMLSHCWHQQWWWLLHMWVHYCGDDFDLQWLLTTSHWLGCWWFLFTFNFFIC